MRGAIVDGVGRAARGRAARLGPGYFANLSLNAK